MTNQDALAQMAIMRAAREAEMPDMGEEDEFSVVPSREDPSRWVVFASLNQGRYQLVCVEPGLTFDLS